MANPTVNMEEIKSLFVFSMPIFHLTHAKHLRSAVGVKAPQPSGYYCSIQCQSGEKVNYSFDLVVLGFGHLQSLC